MNFVDNGVQVLVVLRFGIINRRDLKRYDWASPRGVGPSLACTLLAEFDEPISEIDNLAIDALFFQTSHGPNHWKNTRRRRYEVIEHDVVNEIREAFPNKQWIRVHDMAASSAITSLELFEALAPWKNVELHASDRFDAAFVVTLPTGWRVAFDAERNPWQFIGRGMVISAVRAERKRYPINRLIQRALIARLLPKAVSALESGKNVSRISMFHPKCVALARRDKRFSLGRHNITEREDKSYEVVRLMMHLSAPKVVDFFSDNHVVRSLGAVGRSVADGGLFIAGSSTLAKGIEATIFQRRTHRFVPLRDFSGGYVHRDTVLQLNLD